jgi:hypothetical protein
MDFSEQRIFMALVSGRAVVDSDGSFGNVG